MAVAASLIPGFQYTVTGGIHEDEVVTIVGAGAIPDGEPNQRKIEVRMENGDTEFILPRMLSDRPVAVATAATPPTVNMPEAVMAEAWDVSQAPAVQSVHFSVEPITDPMDPRLDHLRPSRAKVRRSGDQGGYVNRTMPNGMTDVEFLLTFTSDAYRAKNQGRPANVMLKGDTQSGKTFLVEALAVAWADAMGMPKPMPIFTLSGSSGVTDYDLFGQTTSYTDPATGRDGLVWLPGVVDLAARVGGILYGDEINAMGERVTSSLHSLADHRHTFTNRNKAVMKGGALMPEVVVGSLDLWFIGTYNEGYRGMGDMNEAFVGRFRHLPWGYDDAVEGKLLHSPTVRLLGEALRTARATNKVRTPVGTGALQRVEQDIEAFGVDAALSILSGMFKANERPIVDTIIEDRSIAVLLTEEQRQAAMNAATNGGI
jgi:hypothetical protein